MMEPLSTEAAIITLDSKNNDIKFLVPEVSWVAGLGHHHYPSSINLGWVAGSR
jgi:hypothetical protein